MNKLLLLIALVYAQQALAIEKPISNTYKCTKNGCSLACMNIKNNWSTVSDKAKQVTVSHYSSGNIEYFIYYGNETKGNEVIHISEPRLKCKLTGIK